jgi:hypothetical protein
MTISPIPIGIVVLVAVMTASANAQTGKDLFGVCTSKNVVEQMSCDLYISGFVHGLQAAEDLRGEICVPQSLTGNEASLLFTEKLADISRGIEAEANPFFTGPQNAALAAILAMKFPCLQKGK